jgi:hypothetical protein
MSSRAVIVGLGSWQRRSFGKPEVDCVAYLVVALQVGSHSGKNLHAATFSLDAGMLSPGIASVNVRDFVSAAILVTTLRSFIGLFVNFSSYLSLSFKRNLLVDPV